MVRLPVSASRALFALPLALSLALALCACGVKGPLVPAKKSTDAATPAPPPPATTAPEIPSATPSSNPQPAP
jgi:hypothetical protein